METLNREYDNSLVGNAFGFLRTPLIFEPYEYKADIVITGVPFDMATSGRSGTRFGPQAIRQVSPQLAWEQKRYPWNFNVFDRLKVIDCGDLVYAFGDNQNMCEKLFTHADLLIRSGKKMLTLGGDHFITLPLLRAHAKNYGKLSLLHFDAHADTYANGSDYDHGTMFYHAPKECLIDVSKSVQIGIRTEYKEDDGFLVLDGSKVNDMTIDEISTVVNEKLQDSKVYLSFDIDCLDPAYAPGTGTPVVGGLSTDKALKILRSLKDLDIVGMDLVEVSPAYDHAEITALAAATIATEMLYIIGNKK